MTGIGDITSQVRRLREAQAAFLDAGQLPVEGWLLIANALEDMGATLGEDILQVDIADNYGDGVLSMLRLDADVAGEGRPGLAQGLYRVMLLHFWLGMTLTRFATGQPLLQRCD